MKISRLLSAAGLALAFAALAAPGGAQPYPQGMAPQGYRPGGPGYGGHFGRLPLFEVAQWTERETNWDGVWTFDMGAHRRTMSAV